MFHGSFRVQIVVGAEQWRRSATVTAINKTENHKRKGKEVEVKKGRGGKKRKRSLYLKILLW